MFKKIIKKLLNETTKKRRYSSSDRRYSSKHKGYGHKHYKGKRRSRSSFFSS